MAQLHTTLGLPSASRTTALLTGYPTNSRMRLGDATPPPSLPTEKVVHVDQLRPVPALLPPESSTLTGFASGVPYAAALTLPPSSLAPLHATQLPSAAETTAQLPGSKPTLPLLVAVEPRRDERGTVPDAGSYETALESAAQAHLPATSAVPPVAQFPSAVLPPAAQEQHQQLTPSEQVAASMPPCTVAPVGEARSEELPVEPED